MRILSNLYLFLFKRLYGKGFGLGIFNKFNDIVWEGWLRPEYVEIHGLRYYLKRHDPSYSATLGRLEVPEPELTAEFIKRVGPGMTVLDLGANLGYYTILAGRLVGGSGQVLAFEPELENISLLLRNIRANRLANIMVYPYAVATSIGYSELRLGSTSGTHSIAVSPEGSKIQRRIVTIGLDEFLDPSIHPDVIKMDIEGAEVLALKGMRRVLAGERLKTLFVECEPAILSTLGLSVSDLIGHIKPYGFDCRFVDTAKKNLICTKQQLS